MYLAISNTAIINLNQDLHLTQPRDKYLFDHKMFGVF